MQTVSYIGDGSTTEFNFNFPYYENTNIVVTKNNAPATGYQIIGTSGGADADIPYVGGKVVFEVAPTSLDNIIISRQLPLSRAIDYQPTAHIDPTTLNQDMNYMIEVLKDFLDELEIFHNQYADIADKTSTQTLLAQIATINQMVANGEIMKVDQFYSYKSNCITQIPQDIKLTLASGTLTLKSGSKIYVPNGSGTFNTVTTTSDLTMFDSSITYSGQTLICYNSNNNTLVGARFGGTNTIGSGTLAARPAASSMSFGAGLYYATDENKLYIGNKSANTWTEGASLPIAIVTVASGVGCTNIDQVFNGFGYIGAAVYVLPGVKALVPEGRNTDGTLKSTQCTVSSVKVHSFGDGSHCLMLDRNGNIVVGNNFYYDVSLSALSGSDCAYLSDKNEVWRYGSGGLYTPYAALAFTTYTSGGAVTSFKPKAIVRTIDYSDTHVIAHQAMPSNRYNDLTLGTTGATYTAPADGFYTIAKAATASGQYINMINGSNGISSGTVATGAMDCRVFMPVSRGDVVTINYTTAGTTATFRFVYANGTK